MKNEGDKEMMGFIVLKSKYPVEKNDMQTFSIGGYSAISGDGREFCFDWNEMYASTYNDEQGYLIVECDLRDFEIEDYREMNLKNGVAMCELTPEFITNSSITELYYESFKDDVDGEFIRFDLVRFSVLAWDGNKFQQFEFSGDKIDEFNINN